MKNLVQILSQIFDSITRAKTWLMQKFFEKNKIDTVFKKSFYSKFHLTTILYSIQINKEKLQ